MSSPGAIRSNFCAASWPRAVSGSLHTGQRRRAETSHEAAQCLGNMRIHFARGGLPRYANRFGCQPRSMLKASSSLWLFLSTKVTGADERTHPAAASRMSAARDVARQPDRRPGRDSVMVRFYSTRAPHGQHLPDSRADRFPRPPGRRKMGACRTPAMT
jgi:hypothetical protein